MHLAGPIIHHVCFVNNKKFENCKNLLGRSVEWLINSKVFCNCFCHVNVNKHFGFLLTFVHEDFWSMVIPVQKVMTLNDRVDGSHSGVVVCAQDVLKGASNILESLK